MADSVELVVKARPGHGSQQARKLRRQGLVPAVVYGHKEAARSIVLDRVEIEKALRHGHRVVDLKGEGTTEKALVRDVQWDHIGNTLLHVDFSRVSQDERVIVSVPLEVRGLAPGVTAGGILEQPIHSLSIECEAVSVPEQLRVNVSELQLGQSIHVRELQLPPGVKAMIDGDQIVVRVASATDEPEPATGLEGGPVEPEVIGRKAADDEAAED